jgi:hypothetical protein
VAQQFLQALATMIGELDGLGYGVDEPAEDDLGCGPRGIAFVNFTPRDGFFARMGFARSVGSKNTVDGMQQHWGRGIPEYVFHLGVAFWGIHFGVTPEWPTQHGAVLLPFPK